MNKYQEALDSVRKEVKATFFDELGKQWWTTNRDYDYRCNLLQEAIDKANKYDEKETPKKSVFDADIKCGWFCPKCDYRLNTKYINYCPDCGQKLDGS
jgi:rubrerythrin